MKKFLKISAAITVLLILQSCITCYIEPYKPRGGIEELSGEEDLEVL